jgi:uncharacterized protein involved in type VI secretion and phage assembly
MSKNLLDVVAPVNHDQSNQLFGVVVGIVTNNKDDEHMGRVKVKFPWLSDEDESTWARIASPMAGGGRGAYFLPEVNDEVLVAFEHGDPRFPYVLGALWNGKDAPPAENSDGKNNIRVIHSRSGAKFQFDDTEGDEKIEIIDKTGDNSITIKSSDNSIAIKCAGRMTIEARLGIEMSSETDINIKANHISLKGAANITMQGGTVNIN